MADDCCGILRSRKYNGDKKGMNTWDARPVFFVEDPDGNELFFPVPKPETEVA
jgi:hypothetical protein